VPMVARGGDSFDRAARFAVRPAGLPVVATL
jgi:hypothetical protein